MCRITIIKNVTFNSCANFDKQNLPLAFKVIHVYKSAPNVIKIIYYTTPLFGRGQGSIEDTVSRTLAGQTRLHTWSGHETFTSPNMSRLTGAHPASY